VLAGDTHRHRSGQAGDRFRCSREGRIAGGSEPPPAGLDELDLVQVQAVHGRRGQLTARRAGRMGLIHRFDAGVQRRVFGMHLGKGVGGRDVAKLPAYPPGIGNGLEGSTQCFTVRDQPSSWLRRVVPPVCVVNRHRSTLARV
jgi:hypothetical protein